MRRREPASPAPSSNVRKSGTQAAVRRSASSVSAVGEERSGFSPGVFRTFGECRSASARPRLGEKSLSKKLTSCHKKPSPSTLKQWRSVRESPHPTRRSPLGRLEHGLEEDAGEQAPRAGRSPGRQPPRHQGDTTGRPFPSRAASSAPSRGTTGHLIRKSARGRRGPLLTSGANPQVAHAGLIVATPPEIPNERDGRKGAGGGHQHRPSEIPSVNRIENR